jgi:hypothetical protein
MSKDDFFGPVTRLSALAFDIEGTGSFGPIYPPNLTTDQRDQIAVTTYLPGAIVFNTDTEELETYSAAGFWLAILTEESDINVDTITATTGDFDVINCNTINNAHTIHTTDLIASGAVDAASGAISGNLGVNGVLTAGSIGSIGNITTDGNITVVGTAILPNVSSTTMDVNDFEANTARIDSLLYGQSSNTGVSPITASLDVAAGSGASYTMTGSNLGGVFRLVTGTSPAAAGNVIATFTIPSGLLPYLSANWSVILMPASTTTALYETTSNTYVTVGGAASNHFIMGTSALPLIASTTYIWNYILVGNILGT